MTEELHIQKDTVNGSIYIGKLDSENKWTGFGQVSYNNGTKMQGSFKQGFLNGLGLHIKPNGSAEFGKFKMGVKLSEAKDDETMYIYDDMYNEFKEACDEQGIKYFQWIEGEDEMIESDSGLPEEEEDVEGIDIEDCEQEEVENNDNENLKIQEVGDEESAKEEAEGDGLGFSSMMDPNEVFEEEENEAKEDKKLDDETEEQGEEEFQEENLEGEEDEENFDDDEAIEEMEKEKEQEIEDEDSELEPESILLKKKYDGERIEILIKPSPKKIKKKRKKKKKRKRRTRRKKKPSESEGNLEDFFDMLGKKKIRTMTPAKRILSTGEVITPVLDNVNKREAKRYKFKASNSRNYLDPRKPSKIPLDVYLDILCRENHILNYYKSYLERNPKLAKKFLEKNKGIRLMRGMKGSDAILGGLNIGFTAKDLEELRKKYGIAALAELEKLGWSKYDLDEWNRKYGGNDPIDEDLRKKIWAFNTDYQDLYNRILKDKYNDRSKSLEKKARKILELGEKNEKLRNDLENNLKNKKKKPKKRLRVKFASKDPIYSPGNGRNDFDDDDDDEVSPEKLRNFVYFNRKYFSGLFPPRENNSKFNNRGKKLTPYPKGKDFSKFLDYAYPNTTSGGKRPKAFDPYSTTKGTSSKKPKPSELETLQFFLSKSPYDDQESSNRPKTVKTERSRKRRKDPMMNLRRRNSKEPQTERATINDEPEPLPKTDKKKRRKGRSGSVEDWRTYSPYLYHPADYFLKKGKRNKKSNKYNYSDTKGQYSNWPQKGILSKFNSSRKGVVNLSPARRKMLEKDGWTGEGPWYPGGNTLDYHHDRVEHWKHSSPEKVKKFKVY